MQSSIVILCGDKGFFGQTRKPWVSMDVHRIQQVFEERGFSVETHTFHEMTNRRERLKNALIFYSFSQKEALRRYINDLVAYLDDGTNRLIPSYELLKCHENKGYQELYRKKRGIPSLRTYYLTSWRELSDYPVDFPVVFKTLDGSNGKGVHLARSREELIRLVKRYNPPTSLFTTLDLLRRKHLRGKKTYPEYRDYSNEKDYRQYREHVIRENGFLVQDYVHNLTFDYRVLVFYDKYYVMKRHMKQGDFRASGTKLFDFDFDPSVGLLDYARQVFGRMDAAMASLDIGFDGQEYCLFEFQALHFGVSALVRSDRYYSFDGSQWKCTQGQSDLETEVAESVVKYVRGRADG